MADKLRSARDVAEMLAGLAGGPCDTCEHEHSNDDECQLHDNHGGYCRCYRFVPRRGLTFAIETEMIARAKAGAEWMRERAKAAVDASNIGMTAAAFRVNLAIDAIDVGEMNKP
jgi:hypothetical protein